MTRINTNKENEAILRRWRDSFMLFCKEALQFEPTKQQQEAIRILNRLVQVRRKKNVFGKELTEEDEKYYNAVGLSIMSGRGTGKDALSAVFILWFFTMFQPTKIACTAPSAHQLQSVLWSEIYKWAHRRKASGEFVFPLKNALDFYKKNIYKKGHVQKSTFITMKTARPDGSEDEQAETLSGIHEKYMAFILDESSGVPYAVYKPLKASLTNEVNLMLNIFNPNRTTGFAYDIHYGKEKESWLRLRWNAEECERVSETIINDAKRYGMDSNYYRVNVLGLPPLNSDGALIPFHFIQDAINLNVYEKDLENFDVVMGIDPAGEGSDSTIVCIRQGHKVVAFEKVHSPFSDKASEEIMKLIYRYDPKMIYIDKNGVGLGIFSILRTYAPNLTRGIFVQSSAKSDRFSRLRDELWWKLRETLENGLLSIPDLPDFIAELSAPKYDESTGKIKISSKKEIKKEIGKSTDYCDALCMTFCHNDEITQNLNIKDAYDRALDEQENSDGLYGWLAC